MSTEAERAKKAAYMRQYYQDPEKREKKRADERARLENNPEARAQARERAKAWYWANRERSIAAATAWQKKHRTKGRPYGEKNCNWKGDDASYYAIHIWVTTAKGRPSLCEKCGTTTAKRFEWANVDHQYRRVLEDYFRACTSCHRRYDYERGLAKKGGRKPKAAT